MPPTSRPPVLRGALLAALALLPALPVPARPGAPKPGLVSASDSRFRYEGRFDRKHVEGPVVIWQASRIHLDFEGGSLALLFDDPSGQSYFDVEVDDRRFLAGVKHGADGRVHVASDLGEGRHHLTIRKRSEASAGHARFRGVEIEAGRQAFAPVSPEYRLAMEFLGDSITAGACNEDGAEDQWKDRSTHNADKSYASLTADALGADLRSISVSGMGIREGWTDVRAEQAWDRVYPRADSPPADLVSWQPDLVLVNLGENDASFTQAKRKPFPPGFVTAYVSLVQAIRAARPHAHVVLLRGGMGNGARNPVLRDAWGAVVARLEASDPQVSHFVFQHWSKTHPRVADHEAMAAELVAWLRAQPFFSAWADPGSPAELAASPPAP